MRIPFKTDPCCEAISKADPKKVPTQGVQPMEKTIPNRTDDAKVSSVTF